MKALIKWKWICLAVVLLLVPVFWPGVKTALNVDNSLSIWFLDDDPQLQRYRELQEKFGNDETVFLLVRNTRELLEDDFLERLRLFSDSVANLQQTGSVISAGNVRIPKGRMLGMVNTVSLADAGLDVSERKELMNQNPALSRQLFTEDFRATRILIQPYQGAGYEEERKAYLAQLRTLADNYFKQESFHLAGVGVIYDALNRLSEQEFGVFLGIAYLLIFVLIFLIYRSWRLLVWILLTVSLATYFTLGIYGLFGLRLNLMTSLIPVIVTLLGVMDIIHITNQHFQGAPKNDTRLVLQKTWAPCLYTSLTTMAGFLTLFVSPMPILKHFGIFSALGILLSLLLSFLFATFFLANLNLPSRSYNLLKSILDSMSKFAAGRKYPVIGSFCLLLGIAFWGILKVEADSDTLGYLPEDHVVQEDHRMIEKTWGAYLPIEFLVSPPDSVAFWDPELITGIEEWTSRSASMVDGFEQSFGFHSLYQISSQGSAGDDWRATMNSRVKMLQSHRYLVRQYPDLYQRFMHDSSSTARVTFFTRMTTADGLTSSLQEIQQLAEESLSQGVSLEPAGYQPMYATIIQFVIDTQVRSLLLSFVIVLILLLVLLRDVKLALLALVVNLIPIILIFGIMGYFDIHLDTATASIAAIVFTVCIDDTIHFMYYYKEGKGVHATIQSVGVAITVTSLILFIGFGSMVFASLMTVVYFGLLISLAVLFAFFSHIFLFSLLNRQAREAVKK